MAGLIQPQDTQAIDTRQFINFGYAGFRRILRILSRYEEKVITNIVYYPPVHDKAVLANLANRAAWYFPESGISKAKVSIPVDNALLGVDICSLAPPTFQEEYLSASGRVRLTGQDAAGLSKADAIMLWDKKKLVTPFIMKRLFKVYMVDPLFYSTTESESHRQVFYHTLSRQEKETFRNLSLRNYTTLLKSVSECDRAHVFGTGPSLNEATKFDYSGGFNIVCNSIVKNKRLLAHIKPQLLVFADPVFHFSPCRYAAEFRRSMLETVRKYDCHIMLPEYNVPLYLAHYPELNDKIIGMPEGRILNFPTAENFFVRGSENIMTLFMLPAASAVSKEIFIIGADGRNPGESSFWSHSPSSQFKDLMKTASDTHPSFFLDRNYNDYYEKHCNIIDEFIRHGESMGKRYISITPSNIPALSARSASRRKE
jgi:hypothetical protein